MTSSTPTPSFASRIYGVVAAPFNKFHSLLPGVTGTLKVKLATKSGHQLLRLKIEVGSLKTHEDTPSCPATTFYKFRELPAELRKIIWEFSVQEPRIFRLRRYSGDETIRWLPIVFAHKPPPATQACRESRAITRTGGIPLFGSEAGVYKSLWFYPSRDIVYWDKKVISFRKLNHFFHYLNKVQHVAVEFPNAKSNMVLVLKDIHNIFGSCKRVIFTMKHKPLPRGDIKFTYLKAGDDMSIRYDDEIDTWEFVQRGIAELYKESEPLDEYAFCAPPYMDAAEVALVCDGNRHI